MSGCRSKAGRLFQILGPATEKLLSPSRLFVLGTVMTLAWAERSWGRAESAISWQSSTMYTMEQLVDKSGLMVAWNAEERSRRVQRRQGTPDRQVLNSGWRVLSVVMLPPNVHVNVAESYFQTCVGSCWPGNQEPYRVGSDRYTSTQSLYTFQSSQGHATNEAGA